MRGNLVAGHGGRYFLTGNNFKRQSDHNDFMLKENVPAGYFALVTASHGSSLCDFPSSHKFVHEDSKVRAALCKTFRLDKIHIPRNSGFFGHGYMQHARPEWEKKQFLRYRLYLILETHVLGDAFYFACDKLIGVRYGNGEVQGLV